MVIEQLAIPGREIRNRRILAAMAKVPRHEFVPPDVRGEAYEDRPLPIGHDQMISQPFIVAFMTEKIEPEPDDQILEIGTGSGYQAAILAELARQVYSIEFLEPLARNAAATLKRLGYANVTVRAGNGSKGWPDAGPFDAIVVASAIAEIPQQLFDQLKEGGRMIIPAGAGASQELCILGKAEGKMIKRAVLPMRFVPKTGAMRTGKMNWQHKRGRS